MKQLIFLVLLVVSLYAGAQTNKFPSTGSTGIGTTTPDSSSLLEIKSTSKGVLLPRMTKAQRDAIATPKQGLLIYQTNSATGFYVFNGTTWIAVTSSGANKTLSNLTAPTAINQSLLPKSDNTVDLGLSAKRWRNIHASGNAFISGNVGVGTTTPRFFLGYTTLAINHPTNGGVLDFMNNGSPIMSLVNTSSTAAIETTLGIPLIFLPQGVEKMRITPRGGVGIGTGVPRFLSGYTNVAINNDVNGGILDFMNNGSPIMSLVNTSSSAAIETASNIPLVFLPEGVEKMRITPRGGVGIGTGVPRFLNGYTTVAINNDVNGGILDFMNNGSPIMSLINTSSGAAIETSSGIPLVFLPAGTEAMRITPSGRVGIGTVSPLAKVHIRGSGTSGNIPNPHAALVVDGTAKTYINLMTPRTIENGILFGLEADNVSAGIIYNNNAEKKLQFRTGSNNNRITIDSTGKVGIGVSNPAAELEVSGDGQFTTGNSDCEVRFKTNTTNMGWSAGGLVDKMMLYNYATADPIMHVLGNGMVGIGHVPASANAPHNKTARLQIKQLGTANTPGSSLLALLSSDNVYSWNIRIEEGFGNIHFTNNSIGFASSIDYSDGSWHNFSDARLKKDIKDLPPVLKRLLQLKPKSYFRINNKPTDNINFGFIAQEVKDLFPDAVTSSKDADGIEYYSLNYDNFSVFAIKAIQELHSVVELKEEKITSIQVENTALKVRLDAMGEQLDQLQASIADMQNALSKCCLSYSLKDNGGKYEAVAGHLEQNAPNPFSKSTVIRFYIPEKFTSARIDVYAVNGVKMKTLPIKGSGTGQVVISANSLSSGTYSYTLSIDSKTIDTRQMIITR